MPNKIQFRRGNVADLPSLDAGEPGVTTDTHDLYFGSGSGNIQVAKKSDLDATNSSLADIVTLNAKSLPSSLVSLKGDGITDDTLSFQAAINYLASIGGGKLLFPPGVYMINGGLQDPTNFNSIIKLPMVDSVSASPITIQLEGNFFTPTGYPEANNTPPIKNAAIIYSSTLGSGSDPSIIGGPKTGWTDITLVVKNIVFRQPNNPTLNNMQLLYVANVITENIVCDVDTTITNGISIPTNNTGIAIQYPKINNYGVVRGRNIYVTGYYIGILHSEHANLDNIFLQCCYIAIDLKWGYHAARYGKILVQKCQYVLRYDDDTTKFINLYCDVLDIEDEAAGGSWQPIYHISDPSNNIYGFTNMMVRIKGGVGLDNSDLIKNGGNNLLIESSNKYMTTTAPTLLNGATNYDANGSLGFAQAGYTRMGNIVYLTGMIGNTLANPSLVIFTLPIGYRPNKNKFIPVATTDASGTTLGYMRIYPNGNVELNGTKATWTSIECSFDMA